MELSAQQFINAAPQAVFTALNDSEVLRQCIPGCEELERKSDTELSAKMTLKIGPVKATFLSDITLSDINAPHGYTISGQGSGAAAGFVKGGARVRLEAHDGGTMLHYDASVQISGKIAQLGTRLMDASARNLAAKFFKALAAQLAPADTAG